MPLSPEEQAELGQLEGEVGHTVPKGGAAGLSPEEHAEMQRLEGEIGHTVPRQASGRTGEAPAWYEGANESGQESVPTNPESHKALLTHLKTPGMIAGALMAGPAGAAAGAGAGEAIGQAAKSLSGEDVTAGGAAKEVGKAVVEGGLSEIVGSKVIGPTLSKAGSLIAKGISHIPGIDATGEAIKAYAQRAQEVLGMAKSADGNTARAADEMRRQMAIDKQAFHNQINSFTEDALEKHSGQKLNINDTVKALDDGLTKLSNKSGISDEAREAATKEVVGLKSDLHKLADENGEINLLDANKFKQDLQDRAFEGGGHPLNEAAAKNAQAVLRQQINDAVPEVAKYNEQQAAVLELTKRMNRGLITAGKGETGLLAAGAGKNARNVADLADLDKALGTSMLPKAQNLSAMKAFTPAGPGLEGPSLANSIAAPVIRGGAALGRAAQSAAVRPVLGNSVVHGTAGVLGVGRENP